MVILLLLRSTLLVKTGSTADKLFTLSCTCHVCNQYIIFLSHCVTVSGFGRSFIQKHDQTRLAVLLGILLCHFGAAGKLASFAIQFQTVRFTALIREGFAIN